MPRIKHTKPNKHSWSRVSLCQSLAASLQPKELCYDNPKEGDHAHSLAKWFISKKTGWMNLYKRCCTCNMLNTWHAWVLSFLLASTICQIYHYRHWYIVTRQGFLLKMNQNELMVPTKETSHRVKRQIDQNTVILLGYFHPFTTPPTFPFLPPGHGSCWAPGPSTRCSTGRSPRGHRSHLVEKSKPSSWGVVSPHLVQMRTR